MWTRRGFLGASGAAMAMAASAPAWLPRVSFARSSGGPRDVIIQIFMRGGADGLSIVAPYSEPKYYQRRPTIALPRPDDTTAPVDRRAIALNSTGAVMFGLNRALAPLMTAYTNQHLLLVHAAGSTDPTRSHFEAMRYMEVGRNDDPLLTTGWLGRHIATSTPTTPTAPLRALGINDSLQQVLAGAPSALAFGAPQYASLNGASETQAARRSALSTLFAQRNDILKGVAQNTLATLNMLGAIGFDTYVPANGAVYNPDDYFAQSLRATAALIKAQVGVEAIAVDVGGWDTHTLQGNFVGGHMYDNLSDLGKGLAAFYADTLNITQNVLVVVMSEFGRQAHENGDMGTDHGHGNVMMLIGRGVAGGRVYANWPGLEDNQLDDGDLRITTDYRDVIAELVQRRLGNTNLGAIFPGYTPTFRGVTI